jgi:hypothetical protein
LPTPATNLDPALRHLAGQFPGVSPRRRRRP